MFDQRYGKVHIFYFIIYLFPHIKRVYIILNSDVASVKYVQYSDYLRIEYYILYTCSYISTYCGVLSELIFIFRVKFHKNICQTRRKKNFFAEETREPNLLAI